MKCPVCGKELRERVVAHKDKDGKEVLHCSHECASKDGYDIRDWYIKELF